MSSDQWEWLENQVSLTGQETWALFVNGCPEQQDLEFITCPQSQSGQSRKRNILQGLFTSEMNKQQKPDPALKRELGLTTT